MLMERILSRDNLLLALKRVERNKGSHGIDGMSVKFLRRHLYDNWETLRSSLREGTYQPLPVRRVEIPKSNGGVRLLGIPTVTDRFTNHLSKIQLEMDKYIPNNKPLISLATPTMVLKANMKATPVTAITNTMGRIGNIGWKQYIKWYNYFVLNSQNLELEE